MTARALFRMLIVARSGVVLRRARATSLTSILSALYQSALISTAFPRRGVTTQSPIFASIQVS